MCLEKFAYKRVKHYEIATLYVPFGTYNLKEQEYDHKNKNMSAKSRSTKDRGETENNEQKSLEKGYEVL